MKAFVIKNKEGKYYQEDTRLFTEQLYLATFYAEEYFAKKDAIYLSQTFNWEDEYETAEITIAEGDLEEELAIIKRALLKASKEAFGNKASFVSSNYPKKITNPEEYAEYLIFETESEVKNGN